MKSKIDQLIPELSIPEIQDFLKCNILIGNLPIEKQGGMVLLALKKMDLFYKCVSFDYEDTKSLYLGVWVAGLCDITTRQLFGGLINCLTSKTQYIGKPPPNVIAFHHVCKQAQFPASYFDPNAYNAIPAPPDDAKEWNRKKALAKQYLSAIHQEIALEAPKGRPGCPQSIGKVLGAVVSEYRK